MQCKIGCNKVSNIFNMQCTTLCQANASHRPSSTYFPIFVIVALSSLVINSSIELLPQKKFRVHNTILCACHHHDRFDYRFLPPFCSCTHHLRIAFLFTNNSFVSSCSWLRIFPHHIRGHTKYVHVHESILQLKVVLPESSDAAWL